MWTGSRKQQRGMLSKMTFNANVLKIAFDYLARTHACMVLYVLLPQTHRCMWHIGIIGLMGTSIRYNFLPGKLSFFLLNKY